MNETDPIRRLSALLDRLPNSGWGKDSLIHYCCLWLGKSPEPTGVSPTPGRKVRDMVWDLTFDDLSARIEALSEESHITRDFLVCGLLAAVEALLQRMSSPTYARRAIENMERARTLILAQRERPTEERNPPITDDDIERMVEQFEEKIASAGKDCTATEEILKRFNEARAELFPPEYWQENILGEQ